MRDASNLIKPHCVCARGLASCTEAASGRRWVRNQCAGDRRRSWRCGESRGRAATAPSEWRRRWLRRRRCGHNGHLCVVCGARNRSLMVGGGAHRSAIGRSGIDRSPAPTGPAHAWLAGCAHCERAERAKVDSRDSGRLGGEAGRGEPADSARLSAARFVHNDRLLAKHSPLDTTGEKQFHSQRRLKWINRDTFIASLAADANRRTEHSAAAIAAARHYRAARNTRTARGRVLRAGRAGRRAGRAGRRAGAARARQDRPRRQPVTPTAARSR